MIQLLLIIQVTIKTEHCVAKYLKLDFTAFVLLNIMNV